MLIRCVAILIAILGSNFLVAQNEKAKTEKTISTGLFAPTNRNTALADIKKGNLALYVRGGLGVKIKPFDSQDSIFEKNYNVSYFLTTCISAKGDDYKSYNKTILRYLKKEKGLKNYRNVHPGVIGK